MEIPLYKGKYLPAKTIFIIVSIIIGILFPIIFYSFNPKEGILLFAAILFLLIAIFSFIDLKFLLLLVLLLSNYIGFFNRVLFVNNLESPIALESVIYIFAALGLFVVLIKSLNSRENYFILLKNPASAAFLFLLVNLIIQFFNPNLLNHKGWVMTLVATSTSFIIFWISIIALRDLKSIKFFIALWWIVAVSGGLYGCLQDWIGYSSIDQKFLQLSDNPFFHAGYDRKFSIYNDPTIFGIFLSASVVFFIVILIGKVKLLYKLTILISSIIILIAIGYSGTRTAYVMIPGGLLLYFLMTFNNIRTVIVVVVFSFLLGVILFGPIYGNATINRVRTAFIIQKDDPSFEIREKVKHKVQDYIIVNPIGGGMATSGVLGRLYNPGHYLNNFTVDGGYTKIAVEVGWIGLLLMMSFYFTLFVYTVNCYFTMKNSVYKLINLAVLCMYFSLLIATYAQKSTFSFPVGLFFYSSLGVIVNLKKLDKSGAKK